MEAHEGTDVQTGKAAAAVDKPKAVTCREVLDAVGVDGAQQEKEKRIPVPVPPLFLKKATQWDLLFLL